MNNTVKKVKDYADKLLKENAAMISKCEKRIEELTSEREKAGADMVTATEIVDTAAFKEAKKRKDDAEIELGMLQKSLKKLKEDPLMKTEDYEALRNTLFEEHRKRKEEQVKKYAPMIKAMLSDLEAAEEFDGDIDSVLVTLQRNVMRITNRDNLRDDLKGKPYTFSNDRLDNHSVIWFLENLRNIAEEEGFIDD